MREKNINEIIDLAANDNIKAIHELARRNLLGIDVEKNEKKAFELYQKAAEKGNTDSIYMLGFCYYNGRGVEKDYTKAKEYFDTVNQDKNDKNSNYFSGLMYYYGQGVGIDHGKAKEFFVKNAELGDIESNYYAGKLYFYGDGVNVDKQKAEGYFKKAAERNHINAKYYMALNKFDQGDYQGFTEYFKSFVNGIHIGTKEKVFNEESVEQMLETLEAHLDTIYQNAGTNKQMIEDYQYITGKIGDIYQLGYGVKADSNKAFRFYNK